MLIKLLTGLSLGLNSGCFFANDANNFGKLEKLNVAYKYQNVGFKSQTQT